MRLTVQVLLVLQALLRDPGRELYGRKLSPETGLLPGTAYPILLRLEDEGWVPAGGRTSARGRKSGRPGVITS